MRLAHAHFSKCLSDPGSSQQRVERMVVQRKIKNLIALLP